jgi:hypothetical protein
MPRFGALEEDPGATTAGAGVVGAMGAIPGLNFFSPAIAEAIGAGKAAQVRNQQTKNAQQIELPTYEGYDDLTTSYAGDVTAEGYDSPESIEASLANESPEGRAAMLEALRDISRVTDQSVGSTQAKRRQQAEMDARQVANSREQAIKQDSMRRGKVGGAADMLFRQQAAQSAANMNQSAGLESAEQAALQELAGVGAKANIGGNLRAGDQSLAFKNADIMNLINATNTKARNDASQHNVDARNAMALGNRNAHQDFLNNQTQLGLTKKDRTNTTRGKGFADQMAKYGAIDQVLESQAGGARKDAANTRAAGAQGWENTKDVYEMAMSFMGGGMGG